MPNPEQKKYAIRQNFLQILEKANRIASKSELDELLSQMLDLIIEVAGASVGTLYLLDTETNALVLKVVKGSEDGNRLIGKRMKVSQGIAGATIRERIPMMVDDITQDPRWNRDTGELSIATPRNALSVPLLLQERPIGVVQVFNFSFYEPQIIQMLGNRMASEVDKAVLLEASKQRSIRLQVLIDIIGLIGSTLDKDEILKIIVRQASRLLNAEAISLFLIDEDTGDLILSISSNQIEQESEIRVPAGKGIIGHVVKTGETISVNNAKEDRRHYDTIDKVTRFSTQSILAVPLKTNPIVLGGERGESQPKIIGGLEAINKRDGFFNEEDSQLLLTLARQTATVMQIAQFYADADELFLDVIKVLTSAIDAKDPYTRGHSQRVAEFSVTIAKQMGLPPELVRKIKVGAILHDVGKIGISDDILKKPGRLTHDEFSTIQQHPFIGLKIMEQVRMLRSELPAMAEHHERLDGSGYPRGLIGEEISLTARLIATADVFDAMTSDRPYRPAAPVESVFEYLRQGIGTKFDRDCVNALIAAYRSGEIQPQSERGDEEPMDELFH